MSMFAKIVKGSRDVTYRCTHVVKRREDSGIVVEICGGGPEVPRTVKLPDEADVVYLQSDSPGTVGDTVEAIRYRAPSSASDRQLADKLADKPQFRTATESGEGR